jgi:transcriptional regulator with XRE-family HTH domain
MSADFTDFFIMSLSPQLIDLRKKQGLTQQKMANAIGIHVNSLKKYESGQTQPSLDVLRKIALALHVTTDSLLFEDHERGASNDLAMQFEAVSHLPPREQLVVKEVLESLIIKYQARKWDTARDQVSATR